MTTSIHLRVKTIQFLRPMTTVSQLISSQPRYDHFDTSPNMSAGSALSAYYATLSPHLQEACRISLYDPPVRRSFRQNRPQPHSSSPLRCRRFSLKSFWQNLLTFLARRANITKLTIYGGPCGCSTMVRAPAFQAGDAGSIPVTRSIHLRQ